MRETGRKRTDSLARRVAERVRRAVASESFWAVMLKYCFVWSDSTSQSKKRMGCYSSYQSILLVEEFRRFA